MLDKLEDTRTYTYSFWPNDEIKNEIEMKFYQKPIYNYKLECEPNAKTSLLAFEDLLRSDEKASAWFLFYEWLGDSAVAILIVMIVVPIASNRATIILSPLSMIATSGVFAKGIMMALEAADELDSDAASLIENLDWVNNCIDSKAQIDIASFIESKQAIDGVSSQIRIMATMMIV